ncbi:MAG: hypothetical protein SXA11_16640 [Cyanobacteriota bacterium]|nr:hypothetical protein [Cyanobacteriota bacterium]
MLREQKFHLDEKQVQFLARYREYGFTDKTQLVVAALQRLQLELEKRELQDLGLQESPRVDVGELSGMLYEPDRKTVSLEEMEEAIAKCAGESA